MKYFKVIFCLDGGSQAQEMIQVSKELLSQMTADAGFESFVETDSGLEGYIQRDMFDKASVDKIIDDFPLPGIKISYMLEDVADENWNATWEKMGFEPIVIDGRCVIHDALHDVEDTKGLLDITIDAKQAFGTGTHNTTRMMVGEILNMDMAGLSVLDCGQGTGILSIVASKCGAKNVLGYDIDQWSVDNTKHNMHINGVDNIRSLTGDVSVLGNVNEKFDLILANINRNILMADLPVIVTKASPHSTVLLSGFYVDDAHLLEQLMHELGFEKTAEQSKDNWCMLVFSK